MKDSDTMNVEGGTLTCKDAYRGYYQWEGSDDFGGAIQCDLIEARNGRFNYGTWSEHHMRYQSGRSVQRNRFPLGKYHTPSSAIRSFKNRRNAEYDG